MFFKSKGAVDYLVVGLGNPGVKYENTRHNAGYMAVDKIAEKYNCKFEKSKFKGEIAKCSISGKKVLLLKPATYMNLSGESVKAAASFYKLNEQNILVIFDDISLDVGRMRIRRQGSDGGHNGIKNILMYFNENFARIKIGVGKKPHPDYDLAAWVLSKFSKDEQKSLQTVTENTVSAAELIIKGEIDTAMNKFNS
ncbi:MAG: aminoacyl-tRNA hydrolase [Acutalibacteraceae bacterium]|nr:aminoacyl-tRNA hydrolase [Acutalibacteraceae bacterium]